MKTQLASFLLAAALLLTSASCSQTHRLFYGPGGSTTSSVPATQAHGIRYTATWGDPELVHWIDNANGHRWTCTYREFFQYCGKNHPSTMGIAVRGKLPDNIAHPAPPAHQGAAPAQEVAHDTVAAAPSAAKAQGDEPAPYAVPQ